MGSHSTGFDEECRRGLKPNGDLWQPEEVTDALDLR